MSEESQFIRSILATPGDADLRLVYADWLEERGDPRAEFLRLEVELAGIPPDTPEAAKLQNRLRQLREGLDPRWLAWIDKVRIENCDIQFRFQCPQRWENLQTTENPRVRSCQWCERTVFHCQTVNDARVHARRGHCVVIDSRVLRRAGDLVDITTDATQFHVAGGISAPRYDGPPIGRRVRIRDGAFTGMVGEVRELHPDRGLATVTLTLWDRPVTASFEPWQFEAVDANE